MADRSLTLTFLGKDAGAGATAAELAAKLKTLQEVTDRNNKVQAESDAQLKKLEQSFKNADRGMNGLLLTALELGPAMVPIGAVGVGALAGLVPAAAAAGLAFLGLKDAWQRGTLQATQLGQQIQIFRGEFEHLKTIAAGAVMPGLTSALRELQPLFPAVNRNIALFGTQLGQIASHAAPGLVQMFLQLQPLFQTFGDLLVQGSVKFQQWATSGNGIKNFVAYVQAQLPTVLSTFENLAVAASHLIQGFAPFGSTSLTAIKLFSQAISAIPVGVLQALVPLVAGLALGMKALKEAQAASEGLQLLSTKLGTMGLGAQTASGFVGGLGKAVGFLGPIGAAAGLALGGLSIIMGNHAKAAQEAARRTNDLAQAMQDGNTRVTLYSQLVQNGAIPAADKLGISQSEVYNSVTSTGGAMADLKDHIYQLSGRYNELSSYLQSTAAQTDKLTDPKKYYDSVNELNNLGTQLGNLSHGVQQAKKDYDDAAGKVAQYAKAQGDAALAADISSHKTGDLAAAIGVTEDAYIAGALAADKKKESDQAATVAMQQEGDAAGILTQQLNTLNDTLLGSTDANLGFKLANLQLADALKQSKGDLSLSTQAGLQNNQAVDQAIRLAEQDGEALAKSEQGRVSLSKATADGTTKTLGDLQALRSILIQYGGNTQAVHILDQAIRAVQQNHPTTFPNDAPAAKGKADALHTSVDNVPVRHDTRLYAFDDATPTIANIQAGLAAIPQERTILINTVQVGGGGAAIGGRLAGATGGYVSGPGTGTSDSINAWLSNGEYIMNAASVARIGVATLNAMNRYAAGGPVKTAPAGGWHGGGDINVYVTVNGTVTSERNLVSAVRAGIRDQLRSEGKLATVI